MVGDRHPPPESPPGLASSSARPPRRFSHSAIHRSAETYKGNAARIWSGQPSSAEVMYRFLEFDGAGPKTAPHGRQQPRAPIQRTGRRLGFLGYLGGRPCAPRVCPSRTVPRGRNPAPDPLQGAGSASGVSKPHGPFVLGDRAKLVQAPSATMPPVLHEGPVPHWGGEEAEDSALARDGPMSRTTCSPLPGPVKSSPRPRDDPLVPQPRWASRDRPGPGKQTRSPRIAGPAELPLKVKAPGSSPSRHPKGASTLESRHEGPTPNSCCHKRLASPRRATIAETGPVHEGPLAPPSRSSKLPTL